MGKYGRPRAVIILLAAFLMGYLASPVLAVNDEPLDDNWAPSEWGRMTKPGLSIVPLRKWY